MNAQHIDDTLPDTTTQRSNRKPRPISSIANKSSAPTNSASARLASTGPARDFLTAKALETPRVDTYTNVLRRFLLTGAQSGTPATPKYIGLALSNSPLHSATGIKVVGAEATPWLSGVALVCELMEPLIEERQFDRHIRRACHASFLAEVIARVTSSRAPIRSWLATWLAFLVESRSAIDAGVPAEDSRPTLRQLVVVLERLGLYAALQLPRASKTGVSPWNVAAATFNFYAELHDEGTVAGQVLSSNFYPAELPASSRLLLIERSKRLQAESDLFATMLIAGMRSTSGK